MNGKIKFYKPLEFWGKISIDGQSKDIYFNLQSVQNELAQLIEADKYRDEPLVFDIGDSKKPGEKEAKNINLDLTKRKVGHVISFDSERGIGYVEDFNSKNKFFFIIHRLKKEFADKYERIEVGEPIIYSEGSNDKGRCALEITKIDYRSHIEEFSIFFNLRQSLNDLKALAETENWDYLKKPTRGMPVLFSYINQTCSRLIRQNKIAKGPFIKG